MLSRPAPLLVGGESARVAELRAGRDSGAGDGDGELNEPSGESDGLRIV